MPPQDCFRRTLRSIIVEWKAEVNFGDSIDQLYRRAPTPGERDAGPAPHSLRLMETAEFTVDTGARTVVDVTDRVAEFVRARGGDGLLSVFVPHATAGIALMETGSGSEEDLVATLDRLLPRDERYRHRHGSPGHGADHLLPVLVPPSVTIPVAAGRLRIGTWQRVVLVDLNRDNSIRTIRLGLLRA